MGESRNVSVLNAFVQHDGVDDVVTGSIIIWSGTIASIPAGYVLCNGANGTPDLRDRFIVGAKQDDGGIPKTNVTGALLQSQDTKEHTHVISTGAGAPLAAGGNLTTTAANAQHVPPFYALAYIMKT